MQISGNTILITGGGSGIGQALAEKFHAAGNQVIIAGRNAANLDAVTAANPGMASMTFDVGDAASIEAFAAGLVAAHPAVNVIINNAGIMQIEDILQAPANLATTEATVATNLLGPIRLTSALLPHLLKQPAATVMMVTSGLAFVPMVATPTYSATKSAIHAYAMALREQLKGTSTEVVEIIPPYVQTSLTGDHQANDPAAMPLTDFIDEVMAILASDAKVREVIVERCKPLRFAAQQGNFDQIFATLNAPR
ncbi:SDR family oxidoreductase [Sphingobium phenoxybenzoativorans]|uniref:SDR family oxidoreductase n=1 Tax=Sphingobium phenoxybenzoativorans TaxID=1592790 RepID=A0A975Q1J1_9SPHN|nr:SDR family oxidoreductase [Sphingobium phenoxybenzoativorans]QUT06010.1 SDR family oxidoreductase [Sphingobium phenoxybenzoativorans]